MKKDSWKTPDGDKYYIVIVNGHNKVCYISEDPKDNGQECIAATFNNVDELPQVVEAYGYCRRMNKLHQVNLKLKKKGK